VEPSTGVRSRMPRCGAAVRRVGRRCRLDENGRPVAVGSKTRVPSARIRRAVDVRDGRLCTYPGCGRPSEETHHVVHWVDGQRTRSRSLPACAATTTGPTTGAASTSASTPPTVWCGSPAPTAVSSSPGPPPPALSPRRSRSSRAPSPPGGMAARCGSPSSPRHRRNAPHPPACGSPRPNHPRRPRPGSLPPCGAGSSTRGRMDHLGPRPHHRHPRPGRRRQPRHHRAHHPPPAGHHHPHRHRPHRRPRRRPDSPGGDDG